MFISHYTRNPTILYLFKKILRIYPFYLLDCFPSQERAENLCAEHDRTCLNCRAASRMEQKIPRMQSGGERFSFQEGSLRARVSSLACEVLLLLDPGPLRGPPCGPGDCSGGYGRRLPGRAAVFTGPSLPPQAERVPLALGPRLEEALDFSEMEAEPSEGEDFEARGSRFSKSADERQRMLVQRKDDLLQQARK